jgi:hypothetical protein
MDSEWISLDRAHAGRGRNEAKRRHQREAHGYPQFATLTVNHCIYSPPLFFLPTGKEAFCSYWGSLQFFFKSNLMFSDVVNHIFFICASPTWKCHFYVLKLIVKLLLLSNSKHHTVILKCTVDSQRTCLIAHLRSCTFLLTHL